MCVCVCVCSCVCRYIRAPLLCSKQSTLDKPSHNSTSEHECFSLTYTHTHTHTHIHSAISTHLLCSKQSTLGAPSITRLQSKNVSLSLLLTDRHTETTHTHTHTHTHTQCNKHAPLLCSKQSTLEQTTRYSYNSTSEQTTPAITLLQNKRSPITLLQL